MSFNVAVWESKTPASDKSAAAQFAVLYAEHIDERRSRPTAAIRRFVSTITRTYADLTEDDDAPWSDGPLINDASGPIVYFGVVFSRVAEVLPFLATTAKACGLVCFDPQRGRLVRAPSRKGPSGSSTGKATVERVSAQEADTRLREDLPAALDRLGLLPIKRQRSHVVLAGERAHGDVRQRITIVRKRKGEVQIWLTVLHDTISVQLAKALGVHGPVPIIDAPLNHMSKSDSGYATCHTNCLESACVDIGRDLAKQARPILEKLETAKDLHAFVHAKHAPWFVTPANLGTAPDTISAGWLFVSVALAHAVGRSEPKRLAAYAKQIRTWDEEPKLAAVRRRNAALLARVAAAFR